MNAGRLVEWSSVEFQPDLTSPKKKPVRLGAIIHERHKNGDRECVLIGRVPLIGSPPPEFAAVSDITMHLAASWIEHMFKDILEAKPDDIFDFLARRWRWNLYLTDPKPLRPRSNRDGLEIIGKRLYKSLVGVPFRAPATSRRPGSVPPVRVPSPWVLEEFKKRQLGPGASLRAKSRSSDSLSNRAVCM